MAPSLSCPSCGRALGPDDAFCSTCGTRVQSRTLHTNLARRTRAGGAHTVEQRSTCLSCNSPLLPKEQFCPTCGARRAGAEADAQAGDAFRRSILEKLEESTRGRFEFIRQLGSGGMGMVYLARELDLDRLVAIKVLASSWYTDETMVERFHREAKTIASLRHPSIVRVHGVGRAADLHYFVMDYIDGVSLDSILRVHGPLSIPIVRAILYQVGSALSYAHRPSHGVIHRDVKPGNIMVDPEGNSFVTDFGIAKVSQSKSGLTMTGLIMGTPEFMSPEQCRGDTVTIASDQYALGAVLYAMLTGAPPFTGPQYAVLTAHTSQPIPMIRELRPDCPDELAAAVHRMLAKPPAERWPDIKDALTAASARPLLPDDPVREQLTALVRITSAEEEAAASGPALAPDDTGGSDRTPTWLRILSVPPAVETGEVIPLRATVTFADGEEREGRNVRWESTDPRIVRVDPDTGQMVAVGAGSAAIRARCGAMVESIPIEVTAPRVVSVVLEPASLDIEVGETAGVLARARGKGEQALDRPVLWSSSDPRIASVSVDGVVRAHGEGTASLLAHCEGAGAAMRVTVVPARPVAIQLSGVPGTLRMGEHATARARTFDARHQELDRAIVWSTRDPNILSVNPDGTLRAVGVGRTRVVARCEDVQVDADIEILPVQATPEPIAPSAAATAVETAVGRAERPRRRLRPWVLVPTLAIIAGAAVTWAVLSSGPTPSSDTTRVAEPPATPAPVAVVSLLDGNGRPLAGEVRMTVGDTIGLAARARTADGGIAPDVAIEWRSADPDLATIDQNGVVIARSAGSVRLRAAAGDIVGDLLVTIADRDIATGAAPAPATTRPSSEAAVESGTPVRSEPPAGAGRGRQNAAPPPDGKLQLIARPWANISVDGELRATDSKLELSLPPGRHTLHLDNPNLMTVDTTFVIRSRTTTRLTLQLHRRIP